MSNRTNLISPRRLASLIGIPIATLWRWALDHLIPRPVFLGPRIMGWDMRVIDSWLSRVAQLSLIWGANS